MNEHEVINVDELQKRWKSIKDAEKRKDDK